MNLPIEFLQIKMALQSRFPFSETSGFRTKKRNTLVGGSNNSQHQFWLASDIILDNPEEEEAFKEQATRMGLLVIDEGTHLHLQFPKQ